MNKTELIAEVKSKTGKTTAETEAFYSAFWGVIEAALAKGESVNLLGVGAIKTANRPAREGINPKTKAPISIPAKTVASFKFSKSLIEKLNK